MTDHTADVCPFAPDQARQSMLVSDEHFAAIYNIAPILPGHTLVIPKRHVSSLLDLERDELGRFALFARSVTEALVQIFQAAGFNWSLQDGPPAGQTVGHLHLHVIPRYDGDLPDPGDWYPKLQQVITDDSGPIDSNERPRLTTDELEEIATAIRNRGTDIGVFPLRR